MPTAVREGVGLAYAAMTDAAESITVLVPTVDLAPLVGEVAAWTVGEVYPRELDMDVRLLWQAR